MLKFINLPVVLTWLNRHVRPYRQKVVLSRRQQVWLGLMLLLTAAVLTAGFTGLTWLSGLLLLLCVGLLIRVAWHWPAMQISVALTAGLSSLIILTNTSRHVIGFLTVGMGGLLVASLVLAVVVEFANQALISYKHVAALCWSVVITGMLVILLHWSENQTTTLHYAGLPIVTAYDILLLTVVVMVWLFLLFLRSQTRIQGTFIGLLPVSLLGLYVGWLYLAQDMYQQRLPEPVLEHGLLLIHVPAMIIAFALLMNCAGFGLLRLISGTRWLKGGQNRDILETGQNSLGDSLYRQVMLAIMWLGVGLLTGMLWANLAWGHYWQGGAKQVMSMAVWFYYLAGIHLRLQKGMQARAFAWWCVAGLILLVMTFIGTNLWPQGLHTFGAL